MTLFDTFTLSESYQNYSCLSGLGVLSDLGRVEAGEGGLRD